jgi:hypothetical protein
MDEVNRNIALPIKARDYDEENLHNCKRCRFFLPEAIGDQGVCRRYPAQLTITLIPTQNKISQQVQLAQRFDSGWPLVKDSQWCGEWKVMVEVNI